MKTITKSKSARRSRAFLLSMLCAGVVATFMVGCAEGPYVTAYDGGYYVTEDSTFRGALLHGASCQNPSHGEGDAATELDGINV